MILSIVSIFVCALNFIAFFFVMTGWDEAKRIFDGMGAPKMRIVLAVSLIVAALASMTRIYILVFFLAEYLIIFGWNIRRGNNDFKGALIGIFDIVGIMAVELLIFALAYKNVDSRIFMRGMEDIRNRLMVVSGFAMIIFQYIVIVVENIPNMRNKIREGGKVLIAAKLAENGILVYLGILSIRHDDKFFIMILVLILTLVFDYPMFIFALPKARDEKRPMINTDDNVNMYEYYLKMEEEHRQIRKLYHEMKNQMMIMQNAQNQPDRKTGDLEKALNVIEENRNTYHTGQPSLDALLLDSEMRAKEKEIKFEATISQGSLMFIDEDDANLIFRNGILNAIEACEQIEEGQRWITIKAGQNDESTMIYIRNSVSADHQKGNLRTIKKNKKLHGIGLTTIRECVEKYNGYLSVTEKDDSFQMAILFGRGGGI